LNYLKIKVKSEFHSFSGRVGGNCADSAGVSRSELDETSFSPAGSPGVLDEPVVWVGTDQKDSVIDFGTAFVSGEDTSSVQGRPGRSVNANRDWLLNKGVLEIDASISTVVGWDISVTSNGVFSCSSGSSVASSGHFGDT